MEAMSFQHGIPGAVSGLCSRWPWTTDDESPANGPQNSEISNNYEKTDADSQDASETFTAGVRRIWQRPASRGSISKDLPRLAHRITIRTKRGSDIFPPSPEHAQSTGPEGTWALIMRLVSTLVRELEPQRLGYVERGLMDMAARVTDRTDLEMVVPELIRLLGEDSKALRALKMIKALEKERVVESLNDHPRVFALADASQNDVYGWQVDQGVVLLGVHHMKGGVTRGLLTKDVRSADGWQIGIDVFEYVQVYHKRREQSVDIYSGASNHFELDFEVRATFDREMSNLTAAGLRVQRLVCSPTMQPEMRLQLESRIVGDLIIL